jgi:hypothetical protein
VPNSAPATSAADIVERRSFPARIPNMASFDVSGKAEIRE